MSQDLVMDRGTEDAKQFARILYVAHALTFLFSAGLLSLLVLPLYVPTLIFGAEAVERGVRGADALTPLILLAGITAGSAALLPFAAAAAIRVNMR